MHFIISAFSFKFFPLLNSVNLILKLQRIQLKFSWPEKKLEKSLEEISMFAQKKKIIFELDHNGSMENHYISYGTMRKEQVMPSSVRIFNWKEKFGSMKLLKNKSLHSTHKHVVRCENALKAMLNKIRMNQ